MLRPYDCTTNLTAASIHKLEPGKKKTPLWLSTDLQTKLTVKLYLHIHHMLDCLHRSCLSHLSFYLKYGLEITFIYYYFVLLITF